jgi:hypothetical protein
MYTPHSKSAPTLLVRDGRTLPRNGSRTVKTVWLSAGATIPGKKLLAFAVSAPKWAGRPG